MFDYKFDVANNNDVSTNSVTINGDGTMTFSGILSNIFQEDMKSKFPNGAKNVVTSYDDTVRCYYDNKSVALIPNIVWIEVIENEKAKVIIVEFADDTKEKAVLSPDDTFNLEYGISICITKKLLSQMTDGHGGSVYNKLIKYGMKEYEAMKREKEWYDEEERLERERYEKIAKKKAIKKARRDAAEREAYINLQSEAFLRALNEFNKSSNKNNNK